MITYDIDAVRAQLHQAQQQVANKYENKHKTIFVSKITTPYFNFRILPSEKGMTTLPFYVFHSFYLQIGKGISVISLKTINQPCVMQDEIDSISVEYANDEKVMATIKSLRMTRDYRINIIQYDTDTRNALSVAPDNPFTLSMNSTLQSQLLATLTHPLHPIPLYDPTQGKTLCLGITKGVGGQNGGNSTYTLNAYEASDISGLGLIEKMIPLETQARNFIRHPDLQRAYIRAAVLGEPIDPTLQNLKYTPPASPEPIIQENITPTTVAMDTSRVMANSENKTPNQSINDLILNS